MSRSHLALLGLLASGPVAGCGSSNVASTDAGPTHHDAEARADVSVADVSIDHRADHTTHDAGAVDAPVDAPLDALTDTATGPFFDAGDCAVGDAGEPTDLRCTGLYSDWATKTVSADLQPYTPGLALWSDGADKSRWIYLPSGKTIDTMKMDDWTFPVGTKVWKEFRLPVGSSPTPIRIETRLIWKLSDGWFYTTYRWSADGETSATELVRGELDANGAGYEVPNQSECFTCHQGRQDFVMGFEALSMSLPAANGLAMPQLLDAGLLTQPPTGQLAIPGDPTAAAALGWLHVNCGISCHNAEGVAERTDFLMRLDIGTLGSVQDTDTWTTGWNQTTELFHIPDAGTTYRLQACSVATSAAYYRAAHRDNIDGTPQFTQMPPIDTHHLDDAGLALLAAWINEGCDGGGPDAGH